MLAASVARARLAKRVDGSDSSARTTPFADARGRQRATATVASDDDPGLQRRATREDADPVDPRGITTLTEPRRCHDLVASRLRGRRPDLRSDARQLVSAPAIRAFLGATRFDRGSCPWSTHVAPRRGARCKPTSRSARPNRVRATERPSAVPDRASSPATRRRSDGSPDLRAARRTGSARWTRSHLATAVDGRRRRLPDGQLKDFDAKRDRRDRHRLSGRAPYAYASATARGRAKYAIARGSATSGSSSSGCQSFSHSSVSAPS